MESLPQTACLTLPFQEAENITITHRSLDISNNGSASGTTGFIVHEFDTDLCHVTSVSGSAQHAGDLGKFDGLILVTTSVTIQISVSGKGT